MKQVLLTLLSLVFMGLCVPSFADQSSSDDEPVCMLPEGCDEVSAEEILCMLPEGCDEAPSNEELCWLPEGCTKTSLAVVFKAGVLSEGVNFKILEKFAGVFPDSSGIGVSLKITTLLLGFDFITVEVATTDQEFVESLILEFEKNEDIVEVKIEDILGPIGSVTGSN